MNEKKPFRVTDSEKDLIKKLRALSVVDAQFLEKNFLEFGISLNEKMLDSDIIPALQDSAKKGIEIFKIMNSLFSSSKKN